MLFRKKRPDSGPGKPGDAPLRGTPERRDQYRVRVTELAPVRVSIDRPVIAPVPGTCIDLSIGGTWVKVDASHEPRLEPGEMCSLILRADAHPGAIHATCQVVEVKPLDERTLRVGFQFTDRIELYTQLDEFYARLFNRRRHVRIRSDFDSRIPVRIFWSSGSLPAKAFDLSEGGLGVLVPEPRAKDLARISEVDLAFRIPGERTDVACRGVIQSRTEWSHEWLLGIEFAPGGGIEEHLATLHRWLEKRIAVFREWEEGAGKSLRKKRAS